MRIYGIIPLSKFTIMCEFYLRITALLRQCSDTNLATFDWIPASLLATWHEVSSHYNHRHVRTSGIGSLTQVVCI